MDLFIQKNFFSLPTQCALVIDPLGGDAALCINGINGPYISTVWISGREKKLYIPSSANRTASTTAENSVALVTENIYTSRTARQPGSSDPGHTGPFQQSNRYDLTLVTVWYLHFVSLHNT
jgi:hypothetical protein